VQAGQATIRHGDVTETEHYIGEALSVLRASGRTKLLAYALMIAGNARLSGGDLDGARSLLEEALALSKAVGDVRTHDHCEAHLATIAFLAGHITEAIDRARSAAEAARQNGTLMAEFLAQGRAATFLILDGQIAPGRAAALRALELGRAFGNAGLRTSIYQLALVLAAHGKTDTAARLAGFAGGRAGPRQVNPSGIASAIRSRLIERLRCAMGPEECEAAMAAGAAWSEQEAVAAAEAA
jgi:ATP/maltotriose-dependent transcriptional regulator MalT